VIEYLDCLGTCAMAMMCEVGSVVWKVDSLRRGYAEIRLVSRGRADWPRHDPTPMPNQVMTVKCVHDSWFSRSRTHEKGLLDQY
jgi:hypothetical protein